MEKFIIRAYTKSELALRYFPTTADPHVAVNHLMAWIDRCRPLAEALQADGYRKTAKLLSPRQVRLITDHLGDP